MSSRGKAKQETKEMARKVIERAETVGARALKALGETPELIQLRRTERALRSEMDDHMRAIGKRAYVLYKKARGEPPFSRFKTITRELEALTRVEEEYRRNKVQLNRVRERIRGKGRT